MSEENLYLENVLKRIKELGMENSNNYESDLQYKINEILDYKGIPENAYLKNNSNAKDDKTMLDNLLNGQDSIARNETLEELIKQRDDLKDKKIQEIKHRKEEIRSLKTRSSHPYFFNPKLYGDLTKIYSDLDHLAVEEEIKAWKDITFLQLKKMDENGGFYVSKEENYE